VDPQWERNLAGAEEAGLVTGSYHYLWPSRSPEEAANLYFRAAGGKTELPPVLDFETLKGMKAADAAFVAWKFVQLTEEKWGRPCMVYTYPSFWDALYAGRLGGMRVDDRQKIYDLAERDLWIAHYGVRQPKVPLPFQKYKIWQYDGDGGEKLKQPDGRIVDVDFNWFDGDLLDYVKKTGGKIRQVTTDPYRTPRSIPIIRADEGHDA
jgi:lysozyme